MHGTVAASLLLLVAVGSLPANASDDSLDLALRRLRRISTGDWRVTSGLTRSVPYRNEILRAARRHGVAPTLLAALVRAESNFNPRAVSSSGARGLGQLMPRTARELGVGNPFDPHENLDGAARYLSEQLDRFQSVRVALAAYHAGPRKAAGPFNRLPPVTRSYVARVMRYEQDYRAHGLL